MLKENTRVALGIFGMILAMIAGFFGGGAAFLYLLVLLDQSYNGPDAMAYQILGVILSVLGGCLSAVLVGFVLGQFFWNHCSLDD